MSAFRACTSPIPPRPATPRRTALDIADSTMAASQSLAQSITAAATSSRDEAERRSLTSRGRGRLRVDRVARAQRTRRALRPPARPCSRRPRRSGSGRPRSPARCARATSYTVGFVVPDVASPFYAASLKGAQGVLEQAGYRVMLMDSEQDVAGEVAALRTLLDHQVDGLLLSTAGVPASGFRDVVGRAPAVRLLRRVLPGAGAGTVSLENGAGTALLVEHLVEHGHARIALLAGSQRETPARAARAFARRAATARPPRHEQVCAWSRARRRRDGAAALRRPRRPSSPRAPSSRSAA